MVGRIAAGSVDAADDSVDGLIQAAQLQQRLIVEHACRLHKDLRAAKRGPGIEMGVETASGVQPVPPVSRAATADDEPSARQMLACGFAGAPAGRRGIYNDFADAGGAARYERAAVRAGLSEVVASAEIVLLAWPQCGFATRARALLAERAADRPFADVVLPKYGKEHAELALLTGRPSVPYVYVRGELRGGCEADDDFPGLAAALDELEPSRAE